MNAEGLLNAEALVTALTDAELKFGMVMGMVTRFVLAMVNDPLFECTIDETGGGNMTYGDCPFECPCPFTWACPFGKTGGKPWAVRFTWAWAFREAGGGK